MRNVVISYAHMQDVSYVSSPWLPQNLRYTSKPMRSMAHRYLASWLIAHTWRLDLGEFRKLVGSLAYSTLLCLYYLPLFARTKSPEQSSLHPIKPSIAVHSTVFDKY